MEARLIHHRPRHLDHVVCRRLEVQADIATGPDGQPEQTIQCPNCGYTMMYRGQGRLRNGTLVHCYECVHSHREVYSLSVVYTDK
jgi:predicted RNA-binding Zn-ribbon protein involved in translation (DUF1610 family)